MLGIACILHCVSACVRSVPGRMSSSLTNPNTVNRPPLRAARHELGAGRQQYVGAHVLGRPAGYRMGSEQLHVCTPKCVSAIIRG